MDSPHVLSASPQGGRRPDWERLAQLATACSRALRKVLADRLSTVDLSESEFLLLSACAESKADREAAAQIELAKATGLSPAQISGVSERLRERGWIVAERSRDDRRRQHWRLTPEGKRILALAAVRIGELAPHLEGRLDGQSRQELERMLLSLSQAALDAERSLRTTNTAERKAA